MQEKDNLVLIILSGIPCAGKSTWVEENTLKFYDQYKCPIITISRDTIREALFGKDCKFSKKNEDAVTNEFYKQLKVASSFKSAIVILDNTHCKESYIDGYITIFRSMFYAGKLQIYVKFLDVPLWKAYLRNIWRNCKTGKWIPFKVISTMYQNYKKIDKSKYKHLFSNDF